MPILITKDSDFRDSFFLKKTPRKLVKINLGNISNPELTRLLSKNIDAIKKLSTKPYFLLEVDKGYITFSVNDKKTGDK